MPKRPRLYELLPGSFPDSIVYKTLSIEVDPGEVVFSVPAQKHASRRHPEDVPLIAPHLSEVIRDPTYVGDDLRNPGKIELVRFIPGTGGRSALIAITVEKGDDGRYHVCSAYLISQSEVDRKRDKGILRNVSKRI